jgi:hypothetical protein
MPVLEALAVTLLPDDVGRALRIRTGEQGTVRELLDFARPLLRPRALFRDAFIGRREGAAVEIGGRLFHSRVLARNLEGTDLVFPFVLTVGGDLEKEASAQGDLLRQYYLETIADLALSAAAERLREHIQGVFGLKKLGLMDPGSIEDWPLAEQVPLFSLLGDVEIRLSVRLTDSLLMVPRKSISGIFFPSEESFTSCRLCPRAHCQGRRSAYEPELRRSYGLEDGAP